MITSLGFSLFNVTRRAFPCLLQVVTPIHQHLISLRYRGQVWKPFNFLSRLISHKAYATFTSKTQTPFKTPQRKNQPRHHEIKMLTGKILTYIPIIITRQKLHSSTTPLPHPRPRAAIVLQGLSRAKTLKFTIRRQHN